MTALQITADPKCHACNGAGYVIDWVPYGPGNTAMESICECVLEQLTEEQTGDPNLEIEVIDARPDCYEPQDTAPDVYALNADLYEEEAKS